MNAFDVKREKSDGRVGATETRWGIAKAWSLAYWSYVSWEPWGFVAGFFCPLFSATSANQTSGRNAGIFFRDPMMGGKVFASLTKTIQFRTQSW